MNFIEEGFEWAVDKTAQLMEWIGVRVMPPWYDLIYDHDMSILVGMLLLIAAAVACAILSFKSHAYSEEQAQELSGIRA